MGVKTFAAPRRDAVEPRLGERRVAFAAQGVVAEGVERLGLAPKRSTAKLKPGSRMVLGKESIIPKELSEGLDGEEQAG